MANEITDWSKRLYGLSDDMRTKGVDEIHKAVGLAAKESVVDAVTRTPAKDGSLADGVMSGWPRPIVARYDSKGDVVSIRPQGRATGPMRVLEDGRQAYSAGDLRVRGYGKVRANGFRTVKSATVNGRVGATRGKRTWSNAVRDIRTEYMAVAEQALSKILMRYYGR